MQRYWVYMTPCVYVFRDTIDVDSSQSTCDSKKTSGTVSSAAKGIEYVSMVAVDGNRVGGDDPLNC